LYKALEGKVPELDCIGNSAKPRRIFEANSEGYQAGLDL
jgi:hypothetical protein